MCVIFCGRFVPFCNWRLIWRLKQSIGTLVGGTSAALPNTTVDTGAVTASFVPNAGSAGYVTVNTTGSDPDNNASNPDNSQLSMSGTIASPTAVTVNFADDTSDSVVSGAYDATFGINDIDAGSNTGYRDQVTINATDTDGNPLTVTATPNGNFTVINNSNGSVTLIANTGTNSWNNPASYSQITVAGGPIGSITVDLHNVGAAGSHNIMMTDITYTTQPICFVTGTLIEADRGEVAVEELQIGDQVRTADNGYQTIRWVGVNALSAQTLDCVPELRPVRISAGALGGGTPERDLYVSPQHRVLVRSQIAEKMFGAQEVLVAAKQLVILDGIDYCDHPDGVSYVHFLCDRHEVVFANGAASESLFTGPEALKSVGTAARKEIFALFPELMDMQYTPVAARELATGRMGRRLAHRHAQNDKFLVS